MNATDLAHEWRTKADELREFAAEGPAAGIDWCIKHLEEWWRIHETEPLTLDEAAAESGYTYSSLQQMVSGDRLRNIGTKHSPRVCRRDLPRKARAPESERVEGGPDLAQEILERRAAS